MEWNNSSKPRLIGLAIFVGVIWMIQTLNWATRYTLNASFGLIPRHLDGIDGIVGMPFLHGSFSHLMSNTPPILIMGALLATTATRAIWVVNTIIVLVGGTAVWIFGGTGIHVGASGLVFGWFGFLVVRGLIDRSVVTLFTSIVVTLIYASLIWGVLPGQAGISWEAHLAGALAGVIAALIVRNSR